MKSKKLLSLLFFAGLAVFPVAVAAQGGFQGLINLGNDFLRFLYIVLAIVFVLALVVFSWGVVKYLTAAGDATKVKEARNFLFWGIIGLFVLAAIAALVLFVAESLGIGADEVGGGIFEPPKVTTPP